ncbi:hypothetical protein [Haloferula sp. BvORR071]|uniref:hypothetical protein n=1 Tax=Haloferula sp. BvORR071 TaxID=1396141 RepID=UPI000554EB03|nr:hypothetical protein [Haloferula sp. BvORR071]
MPGYRRYTVSRKAKEPLVEFMLDALKSAGCRILQQSDPSIAPFQVSFETSLGERMGIVAYAFLANTKLTKNRPADEHRFQVKYGAKDGALHPLWQDPYGLYTTLFVGINPETGFFVGVDPVLHSPTRMFISIEFKEEQAQRILQEGWHFWEREKTTRGFDSPVETVVGGRAERFLDYVRFEQAALALDQGHRFLLAEQVGQHGGKILNLHQQAAAGEIRTPAARELHGLAREFELDPDDILSLIDTAPRLKMAVRGWVAETHLESLLRGIPEISELRRLEQDGQPDFDLVLRGGKSLRIECKNVLRRQMADGTIRVDFQKTRASKSNPCSRYYRRDEFQVLAACLHPSTEKWEFKYQFTRNLAAHQKCPLHLDNKVRVGPDWFASFQELLTAV